MQLNNQKTAPRTAFTMVELVIVIAIIGILMAFLLPAIGAAVAKARNATVVSEINNLEKAIADFKLKFGVEPPSTFILYERRGDGMNGTPNWGTDSTSDNYDLDGDGNTNNADRLLRQRQSVAFLRQAFPNFNFSTANYDFNGDGDMNDTLVLNGAECLLFFLGGMTATEDSTGPIRNANGGTAGTTPRTPTKWVALGYSTNPATPFARGGSRIPPFYEFDSSRIRDVNAGDMTGRDMPEYFDTLPGQTSPYIFASSNGGRGYNINDLSLSTGSIPVASPSTVYFQDKALLIPYKKNSFQILSPGQDTVYGTGGYYDLEERLPSSRQQDEADNLTNFSSNVLGAN